MKLSEYVIRKLTIIKINESFYSRRSFEVLNSTYFKTFSVLHAITRNTIARKKKEGPIINPEIFKIFLISISVRVD